MIRPVLGIRDEEFLRGDIPMTKQEIRILLLAKAAIQSGDIIIDIGAGTGSISVEAARQSGVGEVYAIEREAEGIELIRRNREKFSVANLREIEGAAPGAMTDLPEADVIFIGGSGGNLPAILKRADELLKPGGRLVLSAVTLETVAMGTAFFREQSSRYQSEAFSVQVTRLKPIKTIHMFQALNPIYIMTGIKNS
ncbi:precorrin-6Y C5,15-methyltransferase (decarboxylating) subunit CbiT [Azotosporobacter soli]|uniref:precorrin-6Y C5,15-methyltransferase (decarboxylating) subunit CbiT n=1 Tax=Azotosporobacter soli TaxID=3055040 RepID=UPI0031FEEBFC